jgi:hypothetical protein
MANTEVAKMEIELVDKGPKLEVASKETAEILAVITIDKENANKEAEIVGAEEAIANEEKSKAEAI